jgi:hypothetical protein
MGGRWDTWAPNAFLDQSGPADQPTNPDGLLLPNSSHAGAGEAVEDLLPLGLPVGGHRLQQGDASKSALARSKGWPTWSDVLVLLRLLALGIYT